MNTVLRITKPLILSRETLTIRNIVKKQFRRELFNKFLSGALNVNATHNQLEYKSNCYSQKLIKEEKIDTRKEPYMRWLHNDLSEERDTQYKVQVLEEVDQRQVTIKSLKKDKRVMPELKEQYEDYKALRDLVKSKNIKNKHNILKELNADMKVLEGNMNPIQSHTTRVVRRNDNDGNVNADILQLREVILRTEFTDKQRDVLYRFMNKISIGNDHKNLDCALRKLFKGINNYKQTMKLDIRPENLYLLR